MKVIPYVNLGGTSEEAMTFYKDVFNAGISFVMRYGEQEDIPVSDKYKQKIMHAQLDIGDQLIYFSDVFEGSPVVEGNTMTIYVDFDTIKEVEEAYKKLSNQAKEVSMPLEDVFWGAKFAAIVDKFGVSWNLSYSYPEE